MFTDESELFTFDARFFRLSATQNSPPAGCPPAGGAFYAVDKPKNFASKVYKQSKFHALSQK